MVLPEEVKFGLPVLSAANVAFDEDAAELIDQLSAVLAFGDFDSHSPYCVGKLLCYLFQPTGIVHLL